MKNLVMFFLLMVVSISQIVYSAESYQRWIYWMNKPSHVATANEMADITNLLGKGAILADSIYKLNSGVTYKIPKPNLYIDYIIKCTQAADASVKTAADASKVILNSEETKWGNDIPYKVKNYFYSTLHKEVRFIGNFSGAEKGIDVLLVNGIPVIKRDCGNPLEVYSEDFTPNYTKSVKVADTIFQRVENKVVVYDTTFVIVQLEEKESPQQYPTTIVYIEESNPPMYYNQWTYPVMMPFIPISCGSYYPSYGWGGGYSNIYVDNSSYYYSNTTNNYRHTTNNNIITPDTRGPIDAVGHDDGNPVDAGGNGGPIDADGHGGDFKTGSMNNPSGLVNRQTQTGSRSQNDDVYGVGSRSAGNNVGSRTSNENITKLNSTRGLKTSGYVDDTYQVGSRTKTDAVRNSRTPQTSNGQKTTALANQNQSRNVTSLPTKTSQLSGRTSVNAGSNPTKTSSLNSSANYGRTSTQRPSSVGGSNYKAQSQQRPVSYGSTTRTASSQQRSNSPQMKSSSYGGQSRGYTSSRPSSSMRSGSSSMSSSRSGGYSGGGRSMSSGASRGGGSYRR